MRMIFGRDALAGPEVRDHSDYRAKPCRRRSIRLYAKFRRVCPLSAVRRQQKYAAAGNLRYDDHGHDTDTLCFGNVDYGGFISDHRHQLCHHRRLGAAQAAAR